MALRLHGNVLPMTRLQLAMNALAGGGASRLEPALSETRQPDADLTEPVSAGSVPVAPIPAE